MAETGAVLVTSDEGTVQDILPAAEAGGDVMTLKGILSPGFVNCHCHLELSHMKGVLPEGTGLVNFLLSVIRQRNTDQQSIIQQAIADAETAMLDNGIVAVGDICNTTDTVSQKSQGNLFYHNFIETMGFVEAAAPQRMAASRDIFNGFAGVYSQPITANSLVPHAPYSVSSALFHLVANFPGNQLLTIHNQETDAENEFRRTGQGDLLRLYQAMGLDTSFFKGTGKRSLPSWLPSFYRNQSIILVHNVATTEEDLAWLEENRGTIPDFSFCLCPNANLYISRQLPDVELLIRSGSPLVVGTDSLASNHQLSILEELKTLQQHLPFLSITTLLQWATLSGAKALQLDAVLGSFTPGKQPGVLVIEHVEGGKLMENSSVRRLL